MDRTVLGALSAVDLAVIAVSLVAVVAVGLWVSRRRPGTSEGYFLAGHRMPWWIIGTSFVATSVSSEQMVGTIGMTYEWGMAIANWEWFAFPTYTILLVVFLPVLLKNRITTVPEYYRERFGPLCADIYSWVMLLAYVFLFTVTVLYSGALAFAEVTDWNFYAVLWLMVISVGVYTVRGGMTSVMWTNMIQCVMLIAAGTLLFFVALNRIPGGWSAMAEANPERFHLYQPADHPRAPFLGLVMGGVGVFLFYQVGNQFMIQRILTARSTWDGLMGLMFSGFINFLRPLTTALLGLVVFHWIHEMHMAEPLEDRDTAFPFALEVFAGNWGARGFILAGFLAAVMSTLSSLSNSTATLFSLDVYKKKLNPNATEDQMVRAGKIVSLAALVIAGVLAPQVRRWGIFDFFQQGVTYLAAPFIAVFLMGILWKRTTYAAALFGMIGGVLLQIAIVVADRLLGNETHWFYLGFIGQVLTMVLVGVVSVFTAAPDPARVSTYVWSPRLLAQYDEGVSRPWYKQVKFWFALWALVWFGIYYRFW